jgi:chorismate synthase
MQKYGFTDARDVLERASARETAARVAAGRSPSCCCAELGVRSCRTSSRWVRRGVRRPPDLADLAQVDESPVRCFDPSGRGDDPRDQGGAKDGDSLGGVVEVLADGVPVGLGSHVHWDRKLDALLAQAVMSIQAVKGVEIGDGFDVAGRRGSEAHDAIRWDDANEQYRRDTTLAGGIEGGMSTGELIVVRAAMKPLATLNVPVLETVDTKTKERAVSFKERTDVTAVPAMGVVAETMVALVLAGRGAAQVRRRLGRRAGPQRRRLPRHPALSAEHRWPPTPRTSSSSA